MQNAFQAYLCNELAVIFYICISFYNKLELFKLLLSRSDTMSYFHYTNIVAERIRNDNIIAIPHQSNVESHLCKDAERESL